MTEAAVFSISTTHELNYSNKEPVPIADIVDSLLGMERIIKNLNPAISGMLGGDVAIGEIRVFITEIRQGSIIKDFAIDIVFGGEEEYKEFRKKIQKLRKKGVDGLSETEQQILKKTIGYLIAAALGTGAVLLATTADGTSASSDVLSHNTTIINFGAMEFGMKPEEIKKIIDSSIQNKKQLAGDTAKVMKPARNEEGASLTIDDNATISFTGKVIRELPDHYEEPKPKEKVVDYQNADLVIFASDRDKHTSGWAGIITNVVQKRVNISLDKNLKPDSIHGRTRVKADVSVIMVYNKKKKVYVPKEIVVHAVS